MNLDEQKKQERLILWVLALANFTHAVDFMIMMPLGPQLAKIFAITEKEHAALVSAYSFAAGFSGFLFSFFADRFDRKKVLIFSYVTFLIGTLACGLSISYEMLLISRAVAGSFGGLLGALLMSVIGDTFPYERRGVAMGYLTSSFSAASIFGVPFSLVLTSHFNWHAPFFFVVIVGVAVLFGFFAFPKMKRAGQVIHKPLTVMRDILKSKNEVTALLFSFILLFSQFLVIPFISPYMVSNVGFQNEQLPYLYFMGGLATIFSAPRVGRLADLYGKHKIFTIFSLLMPIPVLLVTSMGPAPLWIALISTTLFFVFSNGRFIPSNTMITGVVPMERRAGFLSLNASVVQIGLGLGAYLGGQIIVQNAQGQMQNYQYVGYLSVVISFVALVLGRTIKTGN